MSETKRCPYCAETIQAQAVYCKHCNNHLSEHKTVPAKDHKDEHHQKQQESYWKAVLKRWYIHLFLWPVSLPVELIVYLKDRGQAERRRWGMGIFWVIVGSLALTSYVEPGSAWAVWFGFLILLVGIWIHPKKSEPWFGEEGKVLLNRIQHFKTHKIRTGLSIGAFLFALLAFFPQLSQNIEHNKVLAQKEAERIEQQAQQEMIQSYPTPTLEVLSAEGNQGEGTEYELKVKAENATGVWANLQEMKQNPKDETLYSLMIPLDSSENKINIQAKNEYKEVSKSLVITRNETEQEAEERLTLEAQKEQERLEFERLAQEKTAEEARLAQEAQDSMIEEDCQRDWPTDFQMQNYCKKQQYDGIATLELGKPSDISEAEFNIIRNACAKDWPRDFQMRAYCEKQQFDALRE